MAAITEEHDRHGEMFILRHEDTGEATVNTVLKYIQQTYNVCHPVCLGPHSTTLGSTLPVLTPCEYIMRLFRQHGLHSNERHMLLSQEDQMVAIQLVLAEINKKLTGDFDVEVSRVLEFHKRLRRIKLSGSHGNTSLDTSKHTPDLDTSLTDHLNSSVMGLDVDFDKFSEEYATFLKSNNYLDIMDLIYKVTEEVKVNEELAKVIQGDSFLLLEAPQGEEQCALVKQLAGDKQIHWVRIAESLAPSSDEAHIDPDQIMVEDTSLEDLLNSVPVGSPSIVARTSVTENYIEKLILGFLHLLVNSRSEIALARIINTPERGLDHKAFTDIKHAAQNKQLSMYQVATSFILKLRLGGKGYAPDPECALIQHVKGLSEFTDLMNKLQTILEEELDSSNAIKRVLNVIKNTIVKCQDNVIRRASIEIVRDRLQAQADWVIKDMTAQINSTPGRSVAAGGSLVGRKAVRVVRCLLDHSATQPPTVSTLHTLTDVISSQKTPLKFPSIMSQFRSPLEASPEALENQSLVQRMKDKFPVKLSSRIAYNGSCLDWAKPLHDTGVGPEPQSPIILDDYISCGKTIVHPGSGNTMRRRPLESIRDQENAADEQNQATDVVCSRPSVHTNTSSDKTRSTGQTKRPLEDTHNINIQNKRAKVSQSSQLSQATSKAKKPKVSKKKLIPLQKGQKTLGAFFRI